MKIEKQEYAQMAKKASPGSKVLKDCALAFLFGGAICTIGQGLLNFYQYLGSDVKEARAWVSVTLIGVSAILTAFKVYDNMAKYGGAGTLVPITGFANSIVSPAMEFKSEGYVVGIGGKMFVIAGPVLVYSITAGLLYGLIVYFFHLY